MKDVIDTQREAISGTILILGDSITNDGRYVSFLDTYFRLYQPDRKIKLYNYGVSSETLSGLSEPDHPFERPCIFGRLSRILEKVHPNWVIASYGINDGIYYPLSTERFTAYQNGVRKLADEVHKIGAKLIALTPPAFDAKSFSKNYGGLLELGADKYSYMQPYQGYDDVMRQYGEYLKKEEKADFVIDIYSALIEDRKRLTAKDKEVMTGDGIHPDTHGHLTIAAAILKDLFGISTEHFVQVMEEDHFKLFDIIHQKNTLIHVSDIETMGHDNLFKSEYLTGEELEKAVLEKEEEIKEYLRVDS